MTPGTCFVTPPKDDNAANATNDTSSSGSKDQDGANAANDTGASTTNGTGTGAPKGDAAPVVSLDPTSQATGAPLPGFQPAATPELDSLTLMATGLGGFGIYALARWRARSRKRG
jgi:hypothetical protein